MGELYGSKFKASFGEKPNETWGQAIESLTYKQIRRGLQACWHRVDRNGNAKEFAPDLPEFYKLCQIYQHADTSDKPKEIEDLRKISRAARELGKSRVFGKITEVEFKKKWDELGDAVYASQSEVEGYKDAE